MNHQPTGTSSVEPLAAVAMRFAAYTLALSGALALLPQLIVHADITIFKEGGPVEWAQFAVLALTACGLALGAAWIRDFRQLLLFLALTVTLACVRELDGFFTDLFPPVRWELPALLVAICALLVVWRNPRRFLAQAKGFSAYRGFALLWVGFAVAVLFAQLVGHGVFLQMLMGDDYIRDYKRVIEEIGELFGYLLLLIGTVESLLQMAASRRT